MLTVLVLIACIAGAFALAMLWTEIDKGGQRHHAEFYAEMEEHKRRKEGN